MGADIAGAPLFVIACHCRACQRRTGAPLGAGAYFARDDVAFVGPATGYRRTSDKGSTFRSYFCPTCGTSAYWTIDERPDLAGVALGALDNPNLGVAIHSLFERSKHPWLQVGEAEQHHLAGYPSN